MLPSLWFSRGDDDELRREICYVLLLGKMITCDGSETVLLDGATDGIALTIDLSSTVIRQAVAPHEFDQSSLLPTPTLVSDTCSLFLSKRIYIQEWSSYADQLPNASLALVC